MAGGLAPRPDCAGLRDPAGGQLRHGGHRGTEVRISTAFSNDPMLTLQTANGRMIAALARLSEYDTSVKLVPNARPYFTALARLNPGPLRTAIDRLLRACVTRSSSPCSALGQPVRGAVPGDPPARGQAVCHFQHPGVKFLHLLSGRVSYRYGAKMVKLQPGDSLQFDATARHAIEAIEEGPVTYLSIAFTMRE